MSSPWARAVNQHAFHLQPPESVCELSVVVPCHNESGNLETLHRRVAETCAALTSDFEVVLVDDGSTDATWQGIARLSAADAHVVGVKLSRNHGHQLALTAGLHVCRGRRILIIDADLQDPPELLPEMMRLMDEGAEVVYGQRRKREGEGPLKKATAALFYRLIRWLSDVPIPSDTGDFRLMSRRALDVLLSMPERSRFIRGMVSWIGFRQVPLLYDRAPRFAGRTNYNYPKMIRFALDAITGFSIRPLILASLAGVCFALLSLGVVVYALVSWLFFSTVTGWTSLIAVVAALGSVQLFVLGIFGEYLGRLAMQSQGRPLFIIEEVRGPAVPPANTP
jgi:glycosyltransferase involved in cell wall biosynthesis